MRRALTNRLLCAILCCVYILAGIWTDSRITPTGDEPMYFLAADALLHGEGLELSARWYWLPFADYAPGDLLPSDDFERQVSPSLVRRGRYPLHDVGLALLIALPYAVGRRTLVTALIGVAMALAVTLGRALARRLGVGDLASFAAALAVGLAAPALTYSGQVFPDALAPLAVGGALWAIVAGARPSLFGLGVAALPFLHVRLWPLALALVVLYAWARRPPWRAFAAALLPLLATVAFLSVLDLAAYGVPLPHAGFLLFFTARADTALATYASPGGPSLLGLFVDRAFGLLPAAPLAMLAFVGAGRALRSPLGRGLLLAALPYLGALSLLDWTGGYSPQSRYLAPLVPLLVALVALALAMPLARVAALPLAAWTLAQSLVYVVAPHLRYDAFGRPPLADRAWSRVVGTTPSAAFPLLGTDGATLLLAVAWTALLVVLALIGHHASRHDAVTFAWEDGARANDIHR